MNPPTRRVSNAFKQELYETYAFYKNEANYRPHRDALRDALAKKINLKNPEQHDCLESSFETFTKSQQCELLDFFSHLDPVFTNIWKKGIRHIRVRHFNKLWDNAWHDGPGRYEYDFIERDVFSSTCSFRQRTIFHDAAWERYIIQ